MLGELQTKWVEALESGKYEQGRECLCSIVTPFDVKQYCCLGVGCDVLKYESDVIHKYEKRMLSFYNEFEISEKFATEIGLWTPDGKPVFLSFEDIDRFREVVKPLGINDHNALNLA
ncbi:MAG: hypothetical protein ACKVQA_26245, partial [Burkholderiales bacterium]